MLSYWGGEENLCVLSRQVSQPGAELSGYTRHPLFSFSENDRQQEVRKCKQNDHLNDWDKSVRSSQQQLWNVLQRPCKLVLSSTSPLFLPRLSLVSWGGIDNKQHLFFHISKSTITKIWCLHTKTMHMWLSANHNLTCNCRAPSAGHRAGEAKPRLETLHKTLLIVAVHISYVLKVLSPFDH